MAESFGMKRFYKEVAITSEGGILLDGRPVRTPARAPLILPNSQLAEAVAAEWREQGEEIDPRSMPFTGLSNAAIDRVAPDPLAFGDGLARYAETELLCYRAADPPELVSRQDAAWNPILDWAQQRYDVHFMLVTGIMHQPQSEGMQKRLAEAVAALEPFALAAFNPLVTISGSLVIPLAYAEGHLEADAAFDAAHLDELWQEEQWGADDLALTARNVRRADFLAAAQFLKLLG
jgi:chaperone required for assembly of F1-ATPase